MTVQQRVLTDIIRMSKINLFYYYMSEAENQINQLEEKINQTQVKINLMQSEIKRKEYNMESKNKIQAKINSLEAKRKRYGYKIASINACEKAKTLHFVEEIVFDYKKTKKGKIIQKERVPVILYERTIQKEEPMKYYSWPINVKLETMRKKYFPDGGDKEKNQIDVLDIQTGEKIIFNRDH